MATGGSQVIDCDDFYRCHKALHLVTRAAIPAMCRSMSTTMAYQAGTAALYDRKLSEREETQTTKLMSEL